MSDPIETRKVGAQFALPLPPRLARKAGAQFALPYIEPHDGIDHRIDETELRLLARDNYAPGRVAETELRLLAREGLVTGRINRVEVRLLAEFVPPPDKRRVSFVNQ